MLVDLTYREMWTIRCYVESVYKREKPFWGERKDTERLIVKMDKNMRVFAKNRRRKSSCEKNPAGAQPETGVAEPGKKE